MWPQHSFLGFLIKYIWREKYWFDHLWSFSCIFEADSLFEIHVRFWCRVYIKSTFPKDIRLLPFQCDKPINPSFRNPQTIPLTLISDQCSEKMSLWCIWVSEEANSKLTDPNWAFHHLGSQRSHTAQISPTRGLRSAVIFLFLQIIVLECTSEIFRRSEHAILLLWKSALNVNCA